MVGAVHIADGDLILIDSDAANGAVAEQEPGIESVGSLTPGQVEDGAHQVDEESAVADEGDALFGLSILIFMADE